MAISPSLLFFCLLKMLLFSILTVLAEAIEIGVKLSINANIVVGDFGTQLSDNRLYPLNHFVE